MLNRCEDCDTFQQRRTDNKHNFIVRQRRDLIDKPYLCDSCYRQVKQALKFYEQQDKIKEKHDR